jgi:dienelactone hydrolase
MIVVCVALSGSASPGGEDHATFPSADPTLNTPLHATVYLPTGTGPFPGVVALHDCDGISLYKIEWAQWLRTQGYLVIMPDSLAPRHLDDTCGLNRLKFSSHALDGFGALAYLRTRSDVIPDRIAVMGWSHGGAAALLSASRLFVSGHNFLHRGYRAAIALYPDCAVFQDGGITIPLLLLVGSADNWQPPTRCVQRSAELQANGAPVQLKVYPGATHGFDVPKDERTFNVSGIGTVTLRYDAQAAADAHTQVQQFLRARLQ